MTFEDETHTEQQYFIASVRCHEFIGNNGGVLCKEDELAWLGEEDGYAQCTHVKDNAARFETAAEILETWTEWNGMPNW